MFDILCFFKGRTIFHCVNFLNAQLHVLNLGNCGFNEPIFLNYLKLVIPKELQRHVVDLAHEWY